MADRKVKTGGASAVGKRLGVTRRTVFNLEKIGLPKIGPGKYDLAACEKWYADYAAREAMPPEVADIDDIARVLESIVVAIRSRLLALPARLAPQIAACSSIPEVAALIQEEIYRALDELAALSTVGAKEVKKR